MGKRFARWVDELFRIRTRLLLVHVLIVAVPLLGIFFARFYEREMLRALEQNMIDQAEVLRWMLANDPHGVNRQGLAQDLARSARETRTRIRVLDPQGQLVADSHEQGPPEGPEEPLPSLQPGQPRYETAAMSPPEPLDVSQRTEIQAALQGKYGSNTRFWENRDRLYLFSALPIVRDGSVQGVVYVTRSTNPVRSAMYRLRSSLFIILVAALAATSVLSMFLAGTISRPLTRLTHIANRIAKGDRSQTLKMARRDEIGQLAHAFDTMTRKLDDRAKYVGQLAANISHEFKSPLTGIRGAAELLRDGAAEEPEARIRFLGNILADANRLDRLVTRLLELARFEADPIPDEMIDYEELVQEVARQAAATVPVSVQFHTHHPLVFGKRFHLVSALSNLVDNAQQHAAEGTEVSIVVEDGPEERLSTTVHNRGEPIHAINLPRIWDRFFTTRTEKGGTGLGLPIVATVIEAHGGSVSVRSHAAEGTIFRFDLPTVGVGRRAEAR
ncbi:MAG TPA: ATP-binding protein [Polyangiaceae bacterium]|jgi:two-component system sensor histidine kinase ChvG|nr:MAG: Alkaline phosphatase synthesis sensor protein PhoR [Deltaproteobacteria bacterium ADurb.Bin207]HNS96456.1 ATP-binding protein [Polyangiaceae bacterium]HNZ21419.1 ATP-binding protein [Polyangiaceae bacterium]HOD23261.1 ATP-binding protein [Polyangiaceae bacterium]HOH02758.1 ATP-binding protein [Polyangiaceae bacterium]